MTSCVKLSARDKTKPMEVWRLHKTGGSWFLWGNKKFATRAKALQYVAVRCGVEKNWPWKVVRREDECFLYVQHGGTPIPQSDFPRLIDWQLGFDKRYIGFNFEGRRCTI